MTDREVVLLAAAVAVAAAVAWRAPWWVLVVAVVVAAVRRHPVLVGLGLAVAVSALASRAERGLLDVTPGPVEGRARLVSDPDRGLGDVTALVALHGRRYQAVFVDSAAGQVRDRLMGDEVDLRGTVAPLRGPWEWRASRHLVGRLSVRHVDGTRSGPVWWSAVNWIRTAVTDPAQYLAPENRALYLGIVLGDERGQSELMRYRFRASGLAHLLAVSGQNVAFALLVVSPIARRLSLRWRWLVLVGTLAVFALATRLEPSVLRASVMAGVAVTAAWQGRLASGIRLLSIAVIVLLTVDPLLVWSLGFRLSVAATAAVVVLASRLAGEPDATSGRAVGSQRVAASLRRVRLAVGMSLAALAGTSLLLVDVAGTVPLVGPVANVLAVPLGGLLMVWGLATSPLVALVGPPWSAPWVWCTDLLLSAMRTIAGVASWPWLPRAGWVGAVGLTVICLLAAWSPTRGRGRAARAGAMVGAIVLLVGDLVLASRHGTVFDGNGVRIWSRSSAAVAVLEPNTTSRTALDAVLRTGVGRLDLVMVTGGGLRTSQTVLDLRRAVHVGTVLAADPSKVRGALGLREGPVQVGGAAIRVVELDGRWQVRLPP